ncbi:FUSC family protein [Microbacterium capsulatum]|uniref:FUSC family protein n=1 Tax=Microbacterium capsulatum TaxID=3041921 RepID=A0ABU0XLY6_9MICO|nr:FUSC family protein [Microbacterium sp. ASV81]MDQ4215842.1 FUSC family protein [Microbacterium sp. ASV81]
MSRSEPDPARPQTALTRVWVRSHFLLAPAGVPRWPIALQAALSMFLPLALFTLLGQPGAGMMAASGAFTAIYLVGVTPALRIRLLPVIGLAILACAGIGALLAPFPVSAAIGLVVIAILAAALHYGFRLGPPGPVFFVLVYGLSTHLTGLVGGHRLVDPLVFLGALAAGVVIAYAVAVAAFLIRRMRGRGTSGGATQIARIPRLDRDARALLLRVALVAVVGTLLSMLFVDPQRAYWTVCAGLAVIGVNVGRRVAFIRGSQRFVGTVVGAGLFALLAFIPIPVLVLPFLLGGLQFAIEIFVVRNYALALVFITPLVLFIISSAAGPGGGLPLGLILERVVDTLIGAVLGAASGLVHPRSAGRATR